MGNTITSRRILHQPMVNRDCYFEFVRNLGKSSYGTIDLVKDVNDNGREYACKTSLKKDTRSSLKHRNDVRQEVEILRNLKGKSNIVKYKASFEDEEKIHLIIELCRGGNVWDRMLKRKRGFAEREAAIIFGQLIRAIEYCHSMGVMHRDINPLNVMFLECEKDDGAGHEPDEAGVSGKVYRADDGGSLSIRLIDFEFSVILDVGALYTRSYGWDSYMAPEVHHCRYGIEADIWGAGAFLFTLLDAKEPLGTVKDGKTIIEAIMDGDINNSVDQWDNVSKEAKVLVNDILTTDPSRRPTTSQILKDPWMIEHEASEQRHNADCKNVGPDLPHTADTIVEPSRKVNKIKEIVAMMIGDSLTEHDIVRLKELLNSIDSDKDGRITFLQMKHHLHLLENLDIVISEAEVEELMLAADIHGDGKVEFSELIKAIVPNNRLLKEEELFEAYEDLDKLRTGYLSPERVKKALRDHLMDKEDIRNTFETLITDPIPRPVMIFYK